MKEKIPALLARLGPFIGLIFVFALFALLRPGTFLTVDNMRIMLLQTAVVATAALGMTLIIISGGIDLSIGSNIALCTVVVALLLSRNVQPLLSALGGVAVSAAAGALIGGFVTKLKLTPFIVTLGMASVGFCAALYLTSGTPVRGIPYEFADTFGSGGFWGLKAPVWAALMLAIAVYVLLNWTRLGRHFYAVGGNLKAAALSGVHTRLTLFMAYAVCAGLTSIAGLLLTARMETGEANIGTSMPLQSIAACVIAGVSLRGGTGNVPYVVLGAVFFGVIENGMNVSGTSSYLQIGVTGAILVFAAVADEFRRRLIGRRSL